MPRLARLQLVFISTVVAAACQPGSGETTVPSAGMSLANDYFIPVSNGLGKKEQAVTVGDGVLGQQLLFINFDGASIKVTANPLDNATLNESWIPDKVAVGSTIAIPAFDTSQFGLNFNPMMTAQDVKDKIVGYLANWYAAYNVTVTATRPPAGKHYTMIMVGGTTSAVVSTAKDAIGVAPLDCGNTSQVNVGFAFAGTLIAMSPANSSAARDTDILLLAQTIAHESGHSFGLEHVNKTGDIMTPAVSQNVSGFGNTNAPLSNPGEAGSCTASTTQDDDTRLLANLGPAPGAAVVRPTITFLSPKDGDLVPFMFTLAVSASQAAGASGAVTKVVISQSGSTIASFNSPPYRGNFDATGQLPDGTEVTLIATATNTQGNTAQTQSTFTFKTGATQGQVGCLIDVDCDTGMVCKAGACVAGPMPTGCMPACAANETCQSNGSCAPSSTNSDMGSGGGDGGSTSSNPIVGTTCTDSSVCGVGGVCASTGGTNYCTVACDPQNPSICPVSFQCAAVGADHYCTPKSHGCDASGSSSSGSAPLAPICFLFMTAVVLRLRRPRPSAA